MRSCFGQRDWGLEMTMPTKWWLVNGAIKVKSISRCYGNQVNHKYLWYIPTSTSSTAHPTNSHLLLIYRRSSMPLQKLSNQNSSPCPSATFNFHTTWHRWRRRPSLKSPTIERKAIRKILHNTQCEIISLDMAYNNRVQLWLSAGTFTVNNSLSNNDIKNNNCLQWSLTPAPLIDNQKQQSSKAAKATRGRETLEWHIKVTSTTSID